MQLPLVTEHSLLSAYAVARWSLKALSSGYCEHEYGSVGPTGSVCVIRLSMRAAGCPG
jgi:hypothetical protein